MKNRNLNHSDNWATPPAFYAELDKKYHFNFDPCPFDHDVNDWDGLEIEWGTRNYVNPPYSRKIKEAFVNKAVEESKKGKLCVVLLPVSTSTKLFHDVVKPNASSIEFIRGRLPFVGKNDKGQYVNFHLIYDVNPEETIEYESDRLNDEGNPVILSIPKFVKNSGQHDSMLVTFNKN